MWLGVKIADAMGPGPTLKGSQEGMRPGGEQGFLVESWSLMGPVSGQKTVLASAGNK